MITVKCYTPCKALGYASFDEIISCHRISTHWSATMTMKQRDAAEDDEICYTLTLNALDKDGKSLKAIGPVADQVIYIENSAGKTVHKYEFKDMIREVGTVRKCQ